MGREGKVREGKGSNPLECCLCFTYWLISAATSSWSKTTEQDMTKNLTIYPRSIRFDMRFFDFTVFVDDDGVSFAALVAEDGGAVEEEIECGGEFGAWVGEEADLC